VLQDRRSKLVKNQTMMSMAMTEPEAHSEAPFGAPRAGADLRAARERLGWMIEDVSAALRIRLPHLEALESGRIDLLPGNTYAVGFLRSYASALGLNPDEIARRFKAEASEVVNRRPELVFPAPMPQRGVPAGAVVLLGVILAIGAYAGWYRLSGEGRALRDAVPPVPERLATLAEQTTPPALPGARSSTSSSTVASAPATSAPAMPSLPAASSPAVTAPPPVMTAAAPSPPLPEATPEPTALPPPPVPAISPSSAAAAGIVPPPSALDVTPAAPASDQSRIVLQATADAWLQVRDRSNGGVLLNKVLHSGETWPVPPRPNLVLTTGNAGGTELVVDGVATAVPGGSGAVRRDLPLDPDLIKDGKFMLPPTSSSTASSGALLAPNGAAQTGGTAMSGGARSATQ
jgi:cytoskeleton protein RodZ